MTSSIFLVWALANAAIPTYFLGVDIKQKQKKKVTETTERQKLSAVHWIPAITLQASQDHNAGKCVFSHEKSEKALF